MHQQIPPRLGLRCGRSGKIDIISRRQGERCEALLGFGNERGHIAAGRVASDGLCATRPLVKHNVSARSFIDIRKLPQRYVVALGTAQWKIANLFGVTALIWRKYDRHVENPISIVNLAHCFPAIGSLDGVKHIQGIEAPAVNAVLAQTYCDLRHARRGLNLDLSGATNVRQHLCHLASFRVQGIKIIAVRVHYDRGVVAGQRLLDSFREEGLDGRSQRGKSLHDLTDLGLRSFRLGAFQWFEINVDFAVVRSSGIFKHLGPSDLLSDRADVRNLQQFFRHLVSKPHGFF
jgi:hypothetical protein